MANITEFEWKAPIQQGWECPRCGKINAPWVSQCDCPKTQYTVTTTWDPKTTTPINPPAKPSWEYGGTYCKADGVTVAERSDVTYDNPAIPHTYTSQKVSYPNNVCESH